MFLQYGGGGMQKKRRGLFGEDVLGDGMSGDSSPVTTLLDPETTARIAAQYPMKREFTGDLPSITDEPQPLRTENYQELLRTLDPPQVETLSETPTIAGIDPTTKQTVADAQTEAYPSIVAPQAQAAETPVAVTPVAQPDLPPISRSQEYLNQINSIRGKDYSIKETVDENGNVVQVRGKDRKKKWSIGDKVLGILAGAGTGFLQGGLFGAVAGGIKGGTDRNFMAKLGDAQQLPRITADYNQAVQAEANQRKAEMEKANIDILQQKPAVERYKLGQKDTELALRQSRQDFQKVNEGQRTALQSIMKRGYYREGVNPEEDKRLADLGIVLPDFDTRKRERVEQGGRFLERNPDTGKWEEAPGIPVDESEVPIDFVIGGKTMKLRPRDIAGIEASKERQASQQEFQAGENEKNRVQAAQLARERLQVQRDALASAEARAQQARADKNVEAQKKAEQEIRDEKSKLIRLKAFIKSNKYTKDDSDLLGEMTDIEDGN